MALLYPRNDGELDQSFSGREGLGSQIWIYCMLMFKSKECANGVLQSVREKARRMELPLAEMRCRETGFRGTSEVHFGVHLRYV